MAENNEDFILVSGDLHLTQQLVDKFLLPEDIAFTFGNAETVGMTLFMTNIHELFVKKNIHICSAMYLTHFVQFRAALFLLRSGLFEVKLQGVLLSKDETTHWIELSAAQVQVYALQFGIVLSVLECRYKTTSRKELINKLRMSNCESFDSLTTNAQITFDIPYWHQKVFEFQP
jgi:hypothetical protein